MKNIIPTLNLTTSRGLLHCMALCLALTCATATAQTLKIGTDDWPPYEFETGGKITGFSTEILTAVLEKMQVKFEQPATLPWSRAERMLADGDLNILYSSSKSEKRESFAFFPAEPIVDSKWVLFANKADNLTYASLQDLKDKSIAIVNDYAYTPEFLSFVKASAKPENVPGDETSLKMLGNKRVQFAVCEYAVGMALIKKLGIEKDIVAFPAAPIKSTGLYFMFSKKNTQQDFVDKFSAALKEFKTSPDYDKITHKYF